jgi:hypothetical protein
VEYCCDYPQQCRKPFRNVLSEEFGEGGQRKPRTPEVGFNSDSGGGSEGKNADRMCTEKAVLVRFPMKMKTLQGIKLKVAWLHCGKKPIYILYMP